MFGIVQTLPLICPILHFPLFERLLFFPSSLLPPSLSLDPFSYHSDTTQKHLFSLTPRLGTRPSWPFQSPSCSPYILYECLVIIPDILVPCPGYCSKMTLLSSSRKHQCVWYLRQLSSPPQLLNTCCIPFSSILSSSLSINIVPSPLNSFTPVSQYSTSISKWFSLTPRRNTRPSWPF